MTPATLRKWMLENDKNDIDVASMLKITPHTVRNYLSGKKVRRSTNEMFRRLVADSTNQQKAAAS